MDQHYSKSIKISGFDEVGFNLLGWLLSSSLDASVLELSLARDYNKQ